MADATYEVGINIVADDSGLAATIDPASQALEQLATDAETAATDTQTAIGEMATSAQADAATMATSLEGVGASVTSEFGTSGAVPTAVDTGVVSLTSKASKFKGLGSQLGGTLAEGIAGGVSSGDAVGGLVSGITGLAAVSAATGVGAVLGVGLGIGASLIGGMIKSVSAKSDELTAAVTASFDAMEIKAKDTRQTIVDEFLKGLTFKATVDTIGFDKLQAIADNLGVGVEDVVNLLDHDMTAGAENAAAAMNKGVRQMENFRDAGVHASTEMDGIFASAKDLDALLKASNEKQRLAVERGIAERNALRDQKSERDQINSAADRYNDSLQRSIERALKLKDATNVMNGNTNNAADAAARYAAALDRAAAAAGRINAHDNNRWNGVE